MKGNVAKKILSVILALAVIAASFTAGFFIRGCSRGRAVSSYEWGIDVIRKNYYFGDEADFAGMSLGSIADRYLDRYSEYYTAEEYQAALKSNSGSKSGFGLSYSFVDGRGVYTASVVGNSPAYNGGLRAGEWLTSGYISENSTVEFKSSADFQKLLSGVPDGGEVNLVSESGKVYTVGRSEYTASYTYLCAGGSRWIFTDAASGGLALKEVAGEISYLPEGCAYIRLSQFYGSAAEEFFVLAEKFNALNCTSLILDLRSNGGGYVSVMQDIAGAFADGGQQLAMLSRDKWGREEKYYCKKVSDRSKRISKDTRVYVLANSGTASASEALIGAMICYGALEYENVFLSDYSKEYLDWLGSSGQDVKTASTYGKGIMQSTFVNSFTGEALKLTTAKIFWPDKQTCIHDIGLTVKDNGCTAVAAQWQHTLADEELRSAVEIIKTR